MSAAARSVRILIIEDVENDARLLAMELKRSGFAPEWERVETEADFLAQLERGWEIILADYNLPQFNGQRALELLRARGLDIPFIIVSGNIGEEKAVEIMKAGASDYVMKDQLARLGPAVARELQAAVARREQKWSETSMVASEKRYRRLFESAKDGILILNAETGRIVDANPALLELLGSVREKLVGRRLWELAFFKQIITSQEQFEELRGKEFVHSEDLPLKTAAGRHIEVEFVSNIFQVDDYQVIQCNIRDITEWKRAQMALRESERFNQATLDALSSHVAVLDETGNILATNRAWREFARANGTNWKLVSEGTNYLAICQRAEAQGDPATAQIIQGIRAVASGARPVWSQEYPCHSPGEARWFNCRVTRFLGDGPVRVVVAHENITERKLAEEAQARLAQAVTQADESIFITDTDGKILYVNPAFEKTTGYSRTEVLGRNPRLLKSGKQNEAFYRRMWDMLHRGEAWRGHFINRRKDGSLYEEDASISPIRDAAGKIINFVAVKRDVTHEVELEGQLRQAQKMDAVGTLAGGIAHDFNNILNIIFGYSNLLQLDLAGQPDQLEKLGEILKAGQRAKDLVQQILTFSRQREQERQVIQLNTIIKESTKLLRASLPASIQIETELAADAPLVLADATQIYQVIMNLGTNAMHAMENQAAGQLKITLDVFQPDAGFIQKHPEFRAIKYARLTVADTGCGMDAPTLARIYDPFFTTKPIGKGTGLGLAVVHGIVKAHEGVITVESQPGQGTSFRIYFPRQLQSRFQEGISEDAIPCGQGQRILMVDDDASMRRMYQKLLATLEYQGTVVTNPNEAVDLFQKNPGQYDLVITDLTMPDMNGLEVARQIQAIRADMPVILTTGFCSAVSEQRLKEAGICQLIEKPISLAKLAETLQGVLGKT
jgi:PAS domain S-box-containing protein